MPNKNKVLEAVQDTLGEIQDLLQKSGYDMSKAEGEQEAPEAPEMGAEQAPQEAAPEAEGEQAAPEMGAEQAPEAEGEQAPAEGSDELAAQAKDLSDEELDHMLEVLLSEKESRHGGEGEQAAPEAAAEQAPEAAPEAAEKSMKSEFASLAKSMTDSIERLSKEVADLKATKAPAPAKVTSRPAVSNKQQVLEKSTPAKQQKQRLSKSDTLTFLENRMRQRDPAVNSLVIAEICNVRDDSELANIQDRLEVQGVQFPSK
jgi:hypothetical protein